MSWLCQKWQIKSLQTELKKKLHFICCGNASLFGLRLCYSFSAVAIGKLLNVNIIYIAIACTVVLLFECCVCWVLWNMKCLVCVCAFLTIYTNTVPFIVKCFRLKVLLTEYSQKIFLWYVTLLTCYKLLFCYFYEHCCLIRPHIDFKKTYISTDTFFCPKL